MRQQIKTELSNEVSRFTNTIEDMRKQLKQKKNEIVQDKQLIDKQSQNKTISLKNKHQIELKYNANAYQFRMIDRFQSEVGYLRDQNCSLFENLKGHNNQTSTNFLEPSEPKFFSKSINRNTNNLIISDNTYKKIRQSDISLVLGFILIALQQLLIWDKQSNSIRQERNANNSVFMRVIIV